MSLEDFVLNQLQDQVLSGKTRNENWRRKQLHSLSSLIGKQLMTQAISDASGSIYTNVSKQKRDNSYSCPYTAKVTTPQPSH